MKKLTAKRKRQKKPIFESIDRMVGDDVDIYGVDVGPYTTGEKDLIAAIRALVQFMESKGRKW